jgi:histidinol-phosphate aminotransferase
VHFPGSNGHSAVEADAFLQSRRIILRRVAEYGFPDALRMTVGTEEENLAVLDAIKAFLGATGAKRQ